MFADESKVVHLPGAGLNENVKPIKMSMETIDDDKLNSDLNFFIVNAGANHSQFTFNSQNEGISPDSYRYTFGLKSRFAFGSLLGISFDYYSDMNPKQHMGLSGAKDDPAKNFQYAKVSQMAGHLGFRVQSWRWEMELRFGYMSSTVESSVATTSSLDIAGPSFSPIFYGAYDEGVFYFNPFYTFTDGFSLSKSVNHHFGGKLGLISRLWGALKMDASIIAEQYKIQDINNEYFLSRLGFMLGFGF